MARPFKGQTWDRGSAYHTIIIDGSKVFDQILLNEFNLLGYRNTYRTSKFTIQDLYQKYASDDPNSYPPPPEDPLTCDPYTIFDDEFVGQMWDGTRYIERTFTRDEVYILCLYWQAKNTGQEEDFTDFTENSSYERDLEDWLRCKENRLIAYSNTNATCEIFLTEPNAQNPSNSRKATSKGMPIIVATPKTVTDTKYSYKKTKLNQSIDNVGGLVSPTTEDESDPNDQVAAEMALSFNENTGKWEPQTQILVRLITNLDSADIPAVNLSEGSFSNSDFYDKNSPLYLGQKSTAKGVPLSMCDGNPDTYGPNFFECAEKRMEVIRVVNRSNRSFSAGTQVMCNKIDGEWIATDLGSDLEQVPLPPKIENRWQFSKFFINTDTVMNNKLINPTDATYFTPDAIETNFRNQFYKSITEVNYGFDSEIVSILDHAKINTYPELPTDLALGNGTKAATWSGQVGASYQLQSTIFDQLGPQTGGNSSTSYIRRTNMYNPVKGERDGFVGDQYFGGIGLYWGPCFPDGYKSANFYSQAAKPDTPMIAAGGAGPKLMTGGSSVNTAVASNTPDSYGNNPDFAMFGNPEDTNLKQLPPEVALQGKNNPMEEFQSKGRMLDTTGQDFLYALAAFVDQEHIAYLAYDIGDEDGTYGDAFGYEPVSLQTVAFHPLTTIFACSADINSNNEKCSQRDRNWYYDATEYLKGLAGEGTGLVDEDIYGKMFTRLSGNASTYYNTPNAVDCDTIYGSDSNITTGFNQVIYDAYCSSFSTNQPINTVVNPFFDSDACANGLGSNLMGAITARNTFTKPGGGGITFDLEQRFGYNGERINSSSTNVYNSFMAGGTLAGAFIGGVIGPGAVNQLTSAWGSIDNDDIDSMGTTALHNRIFDYWPREQTIFFEPYFAVCHVNPGKFGTLADTETRYSKVNEDSGEIDYNNDSSDLDDASLQAGLANGSIAAWTLDLVSFDCDYRVPTYADGTVIPLYASVNDLDLVRPNQYGRVATYLRGNVISNGGLRYQKNTIGIDPSTMEIEDGGVGFNPGQRVRGPNGITLIVAEVTSREGADGEEGDGGIVTRFGVATESATEENNYVNNQLLGDLDASVFRSGEGGGYVFTVRSDTSSRDATVRVMFGQVYPKLIYQVSPKERIGKTRLSTGSADGKQRITGGVSVTQELPRNDDHKYPNQYEVFFFFHNDITHNQFFEVGTTAGREMPYMQYITMTMK